MVLRDISSWGFFKLILVIEYLIAFFIILFVIIPFVIFTDEKVEFTRNEKFDLELLEISMTVEGIPLVPGIIVSIFWFFIATIIKAWVLKLICRFTPIGKIAVTPIKRFKKRD